MPFLTCAGWYSVRLLRDFKGHFFFVVVRLSSYYPFVAQTNFFLERLRGQLIILGHFSSNKRPTDDGIIISSKRIPKWMSWTINYAVGDWGKNAIVVCLHWELCKYLYFASVIRIDDGRGMKAGQPRRAWWVSNSLVDLNRCQNSESIPIMIAKISLSHAFTGSHGWFTRHFKRIIAPHSSIACWNHFLHKSQCLECNFVWKT